MSLTQPVPAYSQGDQLAPYLRYGCTVMLYLKAGGAQLPIAYRAPGDTPRAPAKLMQIAEPTATLVVEWHGSRKVAKPQPPRIIATGTFLLHSAAGAIHHVHREADTVDVLSASGWMMLVASDRIEDMKMPAFWTPIDGRYDLTMPDELSYYYTPTDLGFAQFLPGADAAVVPGNKLLNSAASGSKL